MTIEREDLEARLDTINPGHAPTSTQIEALRQLVAEELEKLHRELDDFKEQFVYAIQQLKHKPK